jgi:predicted ATPase
LRIQEIRIERWRHFDDIKLNLPDTAPIICVVGGNGTGKSQLLELIAACAQRIGLSPGNESNRGDPFGEGASFEVKFLITPTSIATLEAEHFPDHLKDAYVSWDRTLTVSSAPQFGQRVQAGGMDDSIAAQFAKVAVQRIQQSASIHYLSLDADRAYPKMQIASHQLGEAFERDWETTNKQSSFRITRNLYEEWFRFLLGRENQENNRHIQKIRLARDAGEAEPVFIDQFEGYKSSIKKVLPHLLFVGIDPQKKEIRFDSTGTPLSFDQLSGGEREIAFLIGQIERFSLRKGLLLVDEPELHLNYDLLRSWIGFLKDSVEEGQIWLATHSLEVVEVTGQDATFLLERNDRSRRVTAARPISSQPIVATLSRAVGSPAFSIANLAFVLIEGEEEIGERERFRLLCDIPHHVRFLEAGSCKEVIRRIDGLRDLALASDQTIRIGGIVDGDWRSKQEREELAKQGLFVLGVHEVENFFLEPVTLRELMLQMGQDSSGVDDLLVATADRRAGSWIFDAARTDRMFREYPEPSKAVRELVHKVSWADFADPENRCEEIAAAHGGLDEQQRKHLRNHLVARAKVYARKREDGELWQVCEGKEVFRSLVPRLGFADEDAGERAITAIWARRPELLPTELADLRAYISAL